MQSTLEAHIHTRAHTRVAQVHVQHHPSTAGGTCWRRPIHIPPTHTPLCHPLPPLTLCACVCAQGLVRFDACVCLVREVDPRPTAEHHCGAMWCLPYTRTRSATLAQDPRYACSLAFWCLRHVLDCVLRGSDRVLSHVQSPGTSSLCTGTQKKAIFRHVLKIATRGLSQGLFKESHTS